MAALVSNAGAFFTSANEGTTPPVKHSIGASKAVVAASPEKADDGPLGLMGFVRWVVSLQNRLIATWVQEEKEERKLFKAQEDAKFMERKAELHKRTQDEFGNAKKQVQQLVQTNLMKGSEYKEELDLMKEKISNDRDDWAYHGHILTVVHGSEQADRNRMRKEELAFQKAELGRQVKQESQEFRKRSDIERSTGLEQARQNVRELRHEKEGKIEEALECAAAAAAASPCAPGCHVAIGRPRGPVLVQVRIQSEEGRGRGGEAHRRGVEEDDGGAAQALQRPRKEQP